MLAFYSRISIPSCLRTCSEVTVFATLGLSELLSGKIPGISQLFGQLRMNDQCVGPLALRRVTSKADAWDGVFQVDVLPNEFLDFRSSQSCPYRNEIPELLLLAPCDSFSREREA